MINYECLLYLPKDGVKASHINIRALKTNGHVSLGDEIYIFGDKNVTPKGLYQVGNNSYEHVSVCYPKDTNK